MFAGWLINIEKSAFVLWSKRSRQVRLSINTAKRGNNLYNSSVYASQTHSTHTHMKCTRAVQPGQSSSLAPLSW
ncbi:hypothetical protein E2C01_076507 [Portunus trituberculatus]|uniref:Uncharacterized protein n=1 Tax=Portunus trituberculatus TaxID=210409 RepID=A0A5B7IJ02_PORTR|nr:hypothetical protein [Portunus trituberculatus]